jgi:hypothetical protein
MRFTGQICVGAEKAELGTQVRIEVIDPAEWAHGRMPTPPGEIPKVTDKQRLDYPNAMELRHARLINVACRKRLGELLSPSGPRLEAAEKHASHGYEVVPPPNVRIV